MGQGCGPSSQETTRTESTRDSCGQSQELEDRSQHSNRDRSRSGRRDKGNGLPWMAVLLEPVPPGTGLPQTRLWWVLLPFQGRSYSRAQAFCWVQFPWEPVYHECRFSWGCIFWEPPTVNWTQSSAVSSSARKEATASLKSSPAGVSPSGVQASADIHVGDGASRNQASTDVDGIALYYIGTAVVIHAAI